jgi:AraC-like DNA-binding protein
MIPTHSSEKTKLHKVIVNRLSTLNEYDFNEPHRHGYYEFFYFKEGGGNHVVDFEKFEIESHSIHIVAPGQLHQVNRALDSSGFVYLFELDAIQAGEEINSFLFEHGCYDVKDQSPIYPLPNTSKQEVESIVSEIWQSYQDDNKFSKLSIQNSIQSLCIRAMRLLRKENMKSVNSDYSNFRKLLYRDFRKLKKVQDYADALNISQKQLNEIVKTQTGQTASDVIYGQIILEAKRLLLTGMSAKETAYDLNFDDPAHFSKFFKSKSGYSPSEFQKIHD